MSSFFSRSGGEEIGTTLSRKKRSSRNVPSPISFFKSLLVAAMTRTSTLLTLLDPTLWISPSSRTRSTFDCVLRLMSPISSRKIVPPSACSNLPTLRSVAPVKAPFSWPKSSLSINSSGMAAQLTWTNGSLARMLWLWMALAMSSLPVPLSPWMRIVALVGAVLRMSFQSCFIRGCWPTSS
ncbi:MAG: hypothetical protein WAU81_05875 [Candidatus Aminicenantales bacterium]